MRLPGKHHCGIISILVAGVGLTAAPSAPAASPFEHLGRHASVRIEALDQGTRPESHHNHDGSFEDAFCCRLQACQPPYGGAFAEAYTPPPTATHVYEVLLWVTETGNWWPHPLDVYLWEGGLTSGPGNVLEVATGLVLDNVPTWPTIGENSLILNVPVPAGPFSIGYWTDFSQEYCAWYIAGDRDGTGGRPWINIPAGLGYPSGWQHPAVIWQNPLNALGIGVSYLDLSGGVVEEPYWEPPPAEPRWTWGRIKALYCTH